MLNECATPMGKRQFNFDFTHPITSTSILQDKYTIMEHVLSNFQSWEDFQFRQKMHLFKDWSKISRQIMLQKITPKTFFGLYHNIKLVDTIYSWHNNYTLDYLHKMCPNFAHIKQYCQELLLYLESHLNINVISNIDTFSGEINFLCKGQYPVLDEQNDLLINTEKTLEAVATCFSEFIGMKEKNTRKKSKEEGITEYVKIYETEKNNYSLLCTSRRCKLLEELLPKEEKMITLNHQPFKISKSQFTFGKHTTANCSIEDAQIQTLCKNMSHAKTTIKEMIAKYYMQFVVNFEMFQPIIETIINYITTIDIVYTKCLIAKKYNYCKPIVHENVTHSFVSVKKMRHCLVERLEKELYVTNDLELNDEQNGVLLFGTNAVGKTSFIKALGICVIMAQTGMYVPCSFFEFAPFHSIFTRILGNDDIYNGQSTFEVEMSELRTILTRMDSRSLILGDELCSSTETMSAISIFVSSLQQMHEAKTNFIFATHLHEIVQFEEITSLNRLHMKHMEVIYNKELDKLIYDRKLKEGSGSNSYGLEVCKSLRLPQTFMENAFQIRLKYTPQTTPLLHLKTSHYNSKKIIHYCEKCKNTKNKLGTEVHHIHPQKDADENGFISTDRYTFHKNHPGNLITLCEACHQEIHHPSK